MQQNESICLHTHTQIKDDHKLYGKYDNCQKKR